MALLFTVLCGSVSLCLGYFINYFAKGNIIESAEAVLDSEVRYIEALEGAPPFDTQDKRIYVPIKEGLFFPEGFPTPSKRLAEGLLVFEMPHTGQRYAARIHTLPDERKILIGVDITDISKDFEFMQGIGIASIVFVMLVVFVSYLISIFVVSGTNKIAKTAQEIIKTGDLSRRLEISSKWDDLSNMAGVLNMLLDRIELQMQITRQVSDNIAHDLRTPLTRMRNHIEALHLKEPDKETYDLLLVETDQILATFNALLRISRIETEQQRSQFHMISLDKVLNDVIEFYRPLAEDKNIHLDVSTENLTYYGDRDLLFQAFANILDNAVKFTPHDGQIEIRLKTVSKGISVTIENTGDPVIEDDLPRIFERFYRSENSRSMAGAGLGLSLVYAVITLHNAKVFAQNTEQGFKIITIF
jgi:signal transduction histidine kinase